VNSGGSCSSGEGCGGGGMAVACEVMCFYGYRGIVVVVFQRILSPAHKQTCLASAG